MNMVVFCLTNQRVKYLTSNTNLIFLNILTDLAKLTTYFIAELASRKKYMGLRGLRLFLVSFDLALRNLFYSWLNSALNSSLAPSKLARIIVMQKWLLSLNNVAMVQIQIYRKSPRQAE